MIVANYIYDKVHEGTRNVVDYRSVFPVDREFGWDEVGNFRQGQFILMHAVVYRTDLLRDCGIRLPEHTFYVDNIFVYVPMASVQTIHYLNIDLYHYFIGREDQSVNESVMIGRMDQQLRITRVMIDSVKIPNHELDPHLQAYLVKYLAMMMCICSIFLRMKGDAASDQARKDIWNYLAEAQPHAVSPRPPRARLHRHEPAWRNRPTRRHHRLSRGAEDLQVQLTQGGSQGSRPGIGSPPRRCDSLPTFTSLHGFCL